MSHFEGVTHGADIEWDKNGRPVLYVTAHGTVHLAKPVLDLIGTAVKMINEGPFERVCPVYNLLDVKQVPFLGRFMRSGRIAQSPRTAHIIVATHDPQIRLVASL